MLEMRYCYIIKVVKMTLLCNELNGSSPSVSARVFKYLFDTIN